ncbi:MAG: nucleoside triphosphate pyrophosphatase [Phycisphaerales bacterium]|nr:nucleoside triphosphate pyrophosphatase [Phycisphaerales bacterium]
MASHRFILASASPRRQTLLRDAGYEFDVDPADINEEDYPQGMLPSAIALRLAEAKARAVAARHPEDAILAADTVVAFGDQSLGKPADAAQAKKMLQLLSGTTHLVITGVCVMRQSVPFFKCTRVMSAVKMRFLTPSEVERYVESKDWEGKAGGYGIQDQDPFVTRQSGSHTNIVGLPMSAARQLLEEAGIKPAQNPGSAVG